MIQLYNYVIEQKEKVKKAIYDYVAGYSTHVNDILRKNKTEKDVVKLLDKAFNVYGTAKQIDVYRTVELEYLKNCYGITLDNIESFIGHTITHRGYTSTSDSFINPWGSCWTDDEVIIHITSPRSVKCIVVNDIFRNNEIDCSEQREIILPRSIKFKIVGYHMTNGEKFSSRGNLFIEAQIIN